MKIAVFSDTHGNTGKMLRAVEALRPDAIVHLGDYERDTEGLKKTFPDIPLYQGRLDSLVYAAQEQNCSLALFGHTHLPEYTEMGGVTVINPGTAGKGRKLTWALVEIFENGGIAAEIRDLP